VTYLDTQNRLEYEVRAKAVVLGPSMIESIRILFNSKNREHPGGLANSSGTLGRYLTEHVAFNSIQGFFPQLAGRAASNDDGPGESSLYIPRYNYGNKDKKKFLRGYRFSFATGCGMGAGPGAGLDGFGSAFKKRIKELYPAAVSISGTGEGLAFASNYVEMILMDSRIASILRCDSTLMPNTITLAIRDEMYGQMEEILRASGAEIFLYQKVAPYPLGSVTHEAAVAGWAMIPKPRAGRMEPLPRDQEPAGRRRRRFVTHPEKAITHTIMALSYRACDHLAEEFRLGNV
jgi:hypothetical protein